MNIELKILASLRRMPADRMMPVEALWSEVFMSSMPQPDRPTFNQALRVLENDKKQIIRLKDDDRDVVKITTLGIARHEEAHS